MPNLDNSELIHAFGSTWKNHKYIKKIGNRYFYTMDELRNYKTNNRAKTKETSSIQPRVTREFKTKRSIYPSIFRDFKTNQSIGDTITSGIKKAGEKISDVTGLTAKKRAEAAEQRSDILAEKAARSKKELDAAIDRKYGSKRTVREMQKKAQLYEDEASKSKAAADVRNTKSSYTKMIKLPMLWKKLVVSISIMRHTRERRLIIIDKKCRMLKKKSIS